MKLKDKPVSLNGPDGPVLIERNEQGIPVISGSSLCDIAFGQGWTHGNDRQLQVLLTRIIVQGRAAELLAPDKELIELDTYMRRMNFFPDSEEIIAKIEPEVLVCLESYARGFNQHINENGRVFELKLLGYKPDPLEVKDIIVMSKIMGFLGLADAQGNMEKFILQMIQKGIDEKRIRELFPYITEKIDHEILNKVTMEFPIVPESVKWLSSLPRFIASNNWVVAGECTGSGKPILASDPHLEINRLPNIWQEHILRLPDNTILGVSLPGAPGILIGRNRDLAWGVTFAFMDMIDFRIEECREGNFRRGKGWKPFRKREEIIRVKKKEPVKVQFYENEHGVLEGDPNKEGYYLVMSWAAARGCGHHDFNNMLKILTADNVRDGMKFMGRVECGSWNFVFADTRGNIGYQMSGRLFNRPKKVSGLIPLPGWEEKYNPRGFVDRKYFPSSYNPREGLIVTANQDLNHLGKVKPINLAMASYRADRIRQLLEKRKRLTDTDMKSVHYDLYSIQAEKLMMIMRPELPNTTNGLILGEWDCRYHDFSKGAMLFESVYIELLKTVFGDHGVGREVISFLMQETSLFNDYYGNFDEILLNEKSSWFREMKREEALRRALDSGLNVKPVPYGQTRKVMLANLLFGGKLPSFFGFDHGPIELPGSRATVPQGQIFRSGGRTTTFSPSYRMITDMSTEEIHTNMPGGVSDRRFSKLYLNDLKNWMAGVYKILK